MLLNRSLLEGRSFHRAVQVLFDIFRAGTLNLKVSVIWGLGILTVGVLLCVVRHVVTTLSLIYEVLVAATLEDNSHQVYLVEKADCLIANCFSGGLKKERKEKEKTDKTNNTNVPV